MIQLLSARFTWSNGGSMVLATVASFGITLRYNVIELKSPLTLPFQTKESQVHYIHFVIIQWFK